jgi:SMODS and SLOG-associating 2TM effector domain family 5
MENSESSKWPKHKDHLNKTFVEELAYKLWNTKGIRFTASERLLTMHDLTNKANGFLSAYLIIYSLLAVYQISGNSILDEKIIAFSSTTLSILLLVFTQLEAAQDYKIRALGFHKCALEISELHDKIRIFKTLKIPTNDEKVKFCEEIDEKYNAILRNYPNHDNIDYAYFTTKHRQYYGLSWLLVQKIIIQRYIKSKLLYHGLIGVPFIIIVFLLVYNNS